MPLSLYEISVPVFIRHLNILSDLLSKGSAYADEQKLPHAHLLETRLIEDMQALPYQIQRASDACKGAVVRVAGVDGVVMADDETTFEELHARIQKTIDFLKTVPADSMDGKEEEEVVIKTKDAEWKWTATVYLLEFALPNFFFHVTTAYNILRHKGVPIGKRDYLGAANK